MLFEDMMELLFESLYLLDLTCVAFKGLSLEIYLLS